MDFEAISLKNPRRVIKTGSRVFKIYGADAKVRETDKSIAIELMELW
jgi:hypothetical protein